MGVIGVSFFRKVTFGSLIPRKQKCETVCRRFHGDNENKCRRRCCQGITGPLSIRTAISIWPMRMMNGCFIRKKGLGSVSGGDPVMAQGHQSMTHLVAAFGPFIEQVSCLPSPRLSQKKMGCSGCRCRWSQWSRDESS